MTLGDDEEEVEGEFLTKTDKAILLKLDSGEKVWFPLSQITWNDDLDALDPGDEIAILVPAWLMREKQL